MPGGGVHITRGCENQQGCHPRDSAVKPGTLLKSWCTKLYSQALTLGSSKWMETQSLLESHRDRLGSVALQSGLHHRCHIFWVKDSPPCKITIPTPCDPSLPRSHPAKKLWSCCQPGPILQPVLGRLLRRSEQMQGLSEMHRVRVNGVALG